jgi:predicted RNA polymerase sigma factor
VTAPATTTQRAIEAVFRIESPRLIAGLARIVRDVGLAEELAQEALVTALEKWPDTGVPDNPGAWLMATAKNRAIDELRRGKLLDRKHEELGHDA